MWFVEGDVMVWWVFSGDGEVCGLGFFTVLRVVVCWVLLRVLCRGVFLCFVGECSSQVRVQMFAFFLLCFVCWTI
jgi:hypothetical protein